MEIFNLFTGELDLEPEGHEPPGYEQGRAVRVGKQIGAAKLGMTVYELPPGQAICPYHFEWTDEEWAIVLAGRATARPPGGKGELQAADTMCFPAGPDGAHAIGNRSGETIRVAVLST